MYPLCLREKSKTHGGPCTRASTLPPLGNSKESVDASALLLYCDLCQIGYSVCLVDLHAGLLAPVQYIVAWIQNVIGSLILAINEYDI